MDNYLHFGTEPTDSDLLTRPKSKFGCSFAFVLELLSVIISADRCQRNASKASFSDSVDALLRITTARVSPEYPRRRNMHELTFLSFFFKPLPHRLQSRKYLSGKLWTITSPQRLLDFPTLSQACSLFGRLSGGCRVLKVITVGPVPLFGAQIAGATGVCLPA